MSSLDSLASQMEYELDYLRSLEMKCSQCGTEIPLNCHGLCNTCIVEVYLNQCPELQPSVEDLERGAALLHECNVLQKVSKQLRRAQWVLGATMTIFIIGILIWSLL